MTRFDSVDALRGLTVAAMLLVNNPGDWGHVHAPLRHADWHGCTPTDLVFPMFLFVAGVSLALALGPRREAGTPSGALRREVLLRAARIVALGLLLHAVAWALASDARSFRPMGVLQRIGLCVAAAGWLAAGTRERTQWGVFGAILLGYWALLALGGPLTKEGNLAARVDALLLGRFAYQYDPATGIANEPEGWLSTLPAIATTLLGVRAGDWLRRGRVGTLWVAGAVALAAGFAWSLVFPLNKSLWTSSYVLWTGGWSLLALALAHEAVDRRGWPALGRRFGVNAIAAYAGAWLMVCVLGALGWGAALQARVFAPLTPWVGAETASLAHAVAFVAVWWVVVLVLDRRGVRIKI